MAWQISGQYAETCNCDYLCPCVPSVMTKTTHGYCVFAAGFQIDRGHYNGTRLDGRSFVLVCRTQGEMIEGNFSVGLIVDDGADDKQKEAMRAIATGEAGGPMANMAPMFGTFLGVETAPVKIHGSGREWSVSAGKFVDEAVEGAVNLGGQQMYLDNTGHPANDRLAMATAKKSHLHAFDIDWDQVDGRNNGHFAPFSWSG
jgi:hypothetical protein